MARFGTPDDTRPRDRLDCRVIDIKTTRTTSRWRPTDAPATNGRRRIRSPAADALTLGAGRRTGRIAPNRESPRLCEPPCSLARYGPDTGARHDPAQPA